MGEMYGNSVTICENSLTNHISESALLRTRKKISAFMEQINTQQMLSTIDPAMAL